MRWFHMARVRLGGLLRRRRVDEQLEADLRFHIEQETLENIRRGMAPAEARRVAAREFGGVASATEACRDQRRRPLEWLAEDLKYSWRRLRRTPGFTIVAVLTLALGIGANTSLFSLANGLLFRSLPAPNLDRLVVIGRADSAADVWRSGLTSEQATAIQGSASPLIQNLFTSDPLLGALSADGHAEFVVGELVSGRYFESLEIGARAGRVFTALDDGDGVTPIVISERLWRKWFNSQPSAIGVTAHMAGYPLTIVGVVPDRFSGTWLPTMMSADVWIHIRAEDRLRTVQGGNGLPVQGHRTFARLRPGITLPQVNAALGVIDKRFAREDDGRHLAALPAERGMLFDDFAKPGILIATALVCLSSLVFLIACANLTNLLLARAAGRSGEIAIRLATGASRSGIFRLVITEVVMLTTLGGIAGLCVTWLLTRLMTQVPLPTLEGIHIRFDPTPDWRVFGFAFAIMAVAALAVGILPAWRTSRLAPLRVLAAGGAATGVTATRRSTRSILVAAQVMGSVVLLLAAGLFVRSAIRAYQFDPRYDITSTATAGMNMTLHGFDESRGREVASRILESAARVPGVGRAALTSGLPTSRGGTGGWVAPVGELLSPASRQFARTLGVSPDFFATMRIVVRFGRAFGAIDDAGASPVVIVSESLAGRLWPGRSAIGQRIGRVIFRAPASWDGKDMASALRRAVPVVDGPELEVVGVAADTATSLTNDGMPDGMLYRPFAQEYSPKFAVVVRGPGDPVRLVEPLAQAIRSVDPVLTPMDARTVAESLGVLLTPIRITAVVLSALGVLGFSIAALGLYGVLAYVVTQRRREFGIRMALGATALQLRINVVRSGTLMMLAGAIPGLAIAVLGAGGLNHLLYGINARDPLTFTLVPLSLLAVGLVASWIAGRQVSRIHPSVALRDL